MDASSLRDDRRTVLTSLGVCVCVRTPLAEECLQSKWRCGQPDGGRWGWGWGCGGGLPGMAESSRKLMLLFIGLTSPPTL